jgi:hypothetical protein
MATTGLTTGTAAGIAITATTVILTVIIGKQMTEDQSLELARYLVQASSSFLLEAQMVCRGRPVARQGSYFPDFGDSAGLAVALPFGSNWNSLFNC